MARNKLTETKIKKLSTAGIYSDGDGLYLRVRAGGSKQWFFIYKRDGKRTEIGLGGYGDVTGKILQQLGFMNGNPIGPSELAAVIQEKPLDVSKSLKRLSASRKVTRIGRGKWVLRGLEPKSS